MESKGLKNNNIVIENTLYSLLLYWLINDVDDTIYILESTNIDKSIVNKLKINNDVFLFYDQYEKSKIYRFFSVHILQKIKLYFFIKSRLKTQLKIYGNDDLIAFDIFRKHDYSLLEDGLTNYIFREEKIRIVSLTYYLKKLIRKHCNNKSFGRASKCKKIYLTSLTSVPDSIKEKVKIINTKVLWNKKTEKQQKRILWILNISDEIINTFKNKKTVLLTQPISELGIVSVEEKIEIYKNCIAKYPLEDLIIKPHPRETTDYKKYFPKATIINSSFPFELISLLEIKIDKVITLFSAVALTLDKCIELEWLGAKVHPKLYKNYGDTVDFHIVKNSLENKLL